MTNAILAVVGVIAFILYIFKRRARLRAEEQDSY
jgi:hypothetical protein